MTGTNKVNKVFAAAAAVIRKTVVMRVMIRHSDSCVCLLSAKYFLNHSHKSLKAITCVKAPLPFIDVICLHVSSACFSIIKEITFKISLYKK